MHTGSCFPFCFVLFCFVFRINQRHLAGANIFTNKIICSTSKKVHGPQLSLSLGCWLSRRTVKIIDILELTVYFFPLQLRGKFSLFLRPTVKF